MYYLAGPKQRPGQPEALTLRDQFDLFKRVRPISEGLTGLYPKKRPRECWTLDRLENPGIPP